jgi:hypothetical protein
METTLSSETLRRSIKVLRQRNPLDHRIETQRADNKATMVYVAHTKLDKTKIKIGSSITPFEREYALALGNDEFRLWGAFPGSEQLEHELQGRVWILSADNREIFWVTPDLMQYLTKLIKLRGGVFY